MFTWIISTAQQARPKVIHHSEPVRAHCEQVLGRGDEEALVVELRAQLVEELGGRRCRARARRPRELVFGRIGSSGSSITPIRALPSSRRRRGRAPSSARKIIIAIQPVQPVQSRRHRPGEQEGRFEVEDDEQDRDQVEADVELRAASSNAGKPHSYSAELVGVRPVCAGQARHDIGSTTNAPTAPARRQEQQDRQISGGNAGQGESPGARNVGGALGRSELRGATRLNLSKMAILALAKRPGDQLVQRAVESTVRREIFAALERCGRTRDNR